MKRLSSTLTPLTRFGVPIGWGILGSAMVISSRDWFGWVDLILLIALAQSVWFGYRLSDVWLDGDELVVKGRASFRVSLADVLLLEETGGGRTALVVVLGLDHPVGNVTEVRFMPAGGSVIFGPQPIVKDLQTRIHAARAARAPLSP